MLCESHTGTHSYVLPYLPSCRRQCLPMFPQFLCSSCVSINTGTHRCTQVHTATHPTDRTTKISLKRHAPTRGHRKHRALVVWIIAVIDDGVIITGRQGKYLPIL